jgi:predicted nuclease of predicted toxin-antitoxin system
LKLLIDEHYPPSIAEQLRERGHDAVAVQEEADLRGMLDPDLLTEEQRRNCAVLTECKYVRVAW